ncbi:MAG TPA: potassium channel family protein [Nitrospirota bacterium]|nr:potassium channel family protein [Nitrospirota bacterium]
MSIFVVILGIALILIVLGDAFETVVFPRRVTRRIRLARIFYRTLWRFWTGAVRVLSHGNRQETLLSYFGPLSLPLLLVFWAAVLIVGFALIYWGSGHGVKMPEGVVTFGACLYFSGTTFFTLGLGDISPVTPALRALVVLESGTGFGFLALVISYLPALNQSFSRREITISLLDARAGSPPTAAEILRRHAQGGSTEALTLLLHEWERWSAELLESHLSYPVLAYFRSQHDNQSWLAALTAIIDTSAFVIANMEGESTRQARLTFAMLRHAIVDLALVLRTPPRHPEKDRLSPSDLEAIRAHLVSSGVTLRIGAEADAQLKELRGMYEPYVYALSRRLRLALPPWMLASTRTDNWQISAWGKSKGLFRRNDRSKQRDEEHF